MRTLCCIFLFFFCLTAFPLQAFSFKEKICRGKKGDYIVTEQGKNYTLLFIRFLTDTTLLLEEITTPERPTSWKEWLQEGAHGNTSWILYTVDLKKNALKDCFSFTTRASIPIDQSEEFLTRLMTLPLSRVPLEERRRIGPSPLSGEIDKRSLWSPSIPFEGKKYDKPAFDVFKAKWPEDGTLLASCVIELYFDAKKPNFPFPYWIEIKSPHYSLPIRCIDSGENIFIEQE
jgi:hypothetical protein